MTCHKPGCEMPATYRCPTCKDLVCFMCRSLSAADYCSKECAREHGQTELFTENDTE